MNRVKWDLYYTPLSVAEDILQHLPKYFKPKLVVDICAGKGNFLTSSATILSNENIKHYAFDISLHEDLLKHRNWKITKVNSLKVEAIKQLLPINEKKLVIANPPFGDYFDFFKLDDDSDSLNSLAKEANRTNRIEAKMLVSNMALMKKGDVFAAVLPENIFTSERFAAFKKIFLQSFKVKHLSAPGKFFSQCEVLSRKFVGVFTEIPRVAEREINPVSFNITENSIYRGIDNSLLKPKEKLKGVYTREVIHFNNKTGDQLEEKRIPCGSIKSQIRIAKNDTLVIRVGRNAGQVIHNTKRFEGKLFSDHFLLIKNTKMTKHQSTVLQKRLKQRIKGLTIRYVTKADINASLCGLN